MRAMTKFSVAMVAMKDGFRRLKASTRGVSAVEFALLTPVIMIMMLGLVDYGRAMFNKMELTSAVRAGSQYALADADNSVAGTNAAAIQAAVRAASNLPISTGDVTTTLFCECDGSLMGACSDTCGGTKRTYMTVSIPSFTFDAFFIPDIPLTGTTTVRVE